MSKYDLLMLIHNGYCNGNIEETLAEFDDLIFELTKAKDEFVEGLKCELEEFAVANGICPACREKLVINSYYEDRGEFQGFSSSEEMYYLKCDDDSCPYTYE